MSIPLKWEFFGGKILPRESPEDCLRRELLEELGLQARVGKGLPPSSHSYPTFDITLRPFLCALEFGEIALNEHAAVAWLPPDELKILGWAERSVIYEQTSIR